MEKDNSLPLNHNDLWSRLELATREVDNAIYAELKQYIGDTVVVITDVQFINDGISCILVLEY
jgi:hypothetical protein